MRLGEMIRFGFESVTNKCIDDQYGSHKSRSYYWIDSTGRRECYNGRGLKMLNNKCINIKSGDIINLCFEVSADRKYGKLSCNMANDYHGEDIIISEEIDLNRHTFNLAIAMGIFGSGLIEVELIDFRTIQNNK